MPFVTDIAKSKLKEGQKVSRGHWEAGKFLSLGKDGLVKFSLDTSISFKLDDDYEVWPALCGTDLKEAIDWRIAPDK